jgi:hypothetical protein
MNRLFLTLVSLVIATAPAVVDICRIDCERVRQTECPLHQPTPHKCAHDHAIAQGALGSATSDAAGPRLVAVDAARIHIANTFVSIDRSSTPIRLISPICCPHIVPLRI